MNVLPRDPTTFGDEQFVHDGRTVHVNAVIDAPKLAVLSGLLSSEECAALIAEARSLMAPSLVIDAQNVGATLDDSRTSSGMHFPLGVSAIADQIQRRMMSVIELPIDRAEPLQVLRYGPGDEYVAHYDFFDADDPSNSDHAGESGPTTTVSQFGQRCATMICYLSEVESGGATEFPDAGFEVLPEPGRAVYFTYLDAHGQVDRMSLHGGAPVLSGEKWIVTQWCRQRSYRAPSS